MSKKTKTAVGLAILAALAAFGLAATAKADDGNGGNGNGGNGKWKGPGPGKPGAPRPGKPKGGSTRPTEVDPWDLWISPDCDDLMIGPDWMSDTAEPAIAEWLASGYGAPMYEFDDDWKGAVKFGSAAVVRGILGPYSPLCLDAYPWADMYNLRNPKPEWQAPDGGQELQDWSDELASKQAQWERDAPGLSRLIQDLEAAVIDAWMAENG